MTLGKVSTSPESARAGRHIARAAAKAARASRSLGSRHCSSLHVLKLPSCQMGRPRQPTHDPHVPEPEGNALLGMAAAGAENRCNWRWNSRWNHCSKIRPGELLADLGRDSSPERGSAGQGRNVASNRPSTWTFRWPGHWRTRGSRTERLLIGPAGGFYSACSEDIYPNCWSAIYAADAVKKALKEQHLQDALQSISPSLANHAWRLPARAAAEPALSAADGVPEPEDDRPADRINFDGKERRPIKSASYNSPQFNTERTP